MLHHKVRESLPCRTWSRKWQFCRKPQDSTKRTRFSMRSSRSMQESWRTRGGSRQQCDTFACCEMMHRLPSSATVFIIPRQCRWGSSSDVHLLSLSNPPMSASCMCNSNSRCTHPSRPSLSPMLLHQGPTCPTCQCHKHGACLRTQVCRQRQHLGPLLTQ